MPIPVKATIGSCDSPIYKGNEYCQQQLPPSNNPLEQLVTSLGQAISGDSIVKFGRRFKVITREFNSTGTSIHAIDFLEVVPKDSIWFLQKFNFVGDSGSTINTWAWLAMPPQTKTRFPVIQSGIASGDVLQHSIGGLVLHVGDTANDIIIGSTQMERVTNGKLLTIPEGFFIRFIANVGGTGARHNLNVLLAELNIQDIEFQPAGLISNEFTSKNPTTADIPQAVKSNGNGLRNALTKCFTCPSCGKSHNERRNNGA